MLVYLPVAEMPIDMFMGLAMGAAVGFISGLFGVGGGFLLTPLLIFAGIPPAASVATVSAQVLASSTTGSLGAWQRHAIDFRLGGVLMAGGLVGTVLGILFFNQMRDVGQLDVIIQLSYVTLLGFIGTTMLAESLRALTRRKGVAVAPSGPPPRWQSLMPLRMEFRTSGVTASAVLVVLLGTFIGFAGTLLGIGGGFLLVPALIYFFRVPTAVVVGTSQFLILFTMLAATILHAVTDRSVDIILALMLVIGGVFGAQFGARAGRNLRGEHFRLLMALIVLTVAGRFAVDLVAQPTEPYSLATSRR